MLVVFVISLLVGAEVAALDRRATFEEERREKLRLEQRAYSRDLDRAQLPSEADCLAAVREWEDRNAVCRGQCGEEIDVLGEGGLAALPCEDSSPEQQPLPGDEEGGSCRLSDKYMLETEERAEDFLKLRSKVLLAKVRVYASDCQNTFLSSLQNLVQPSKWQGCHRLAEEVNQAISFLSKARSVMPGASATSGPLVDHVENVLKYTAAQMLPAGGLSDEDQGLFHQLAADARTKYQESVEKYPTFVAQNAVEVLVDLIQGSGDERRAAEERVRSGAVFRLSAEQRKVAEDMDRQREMDEEEQELAMSILLGEEHETNVDLSRAVTESLTGLTVRPTSLVETRVVSAEGTELARSGSELQGGAWVGGVLFVLIAFGVLAGFLFFSWPAVLPWILVFIGSAIVGCGFFAGGKHLWDRSQRHKRMKLEWEAEQKKIAEKAARKANRPKTTLGKMQAALGFEKKREQAEASGQPSVAQQTFGAAQQPAPQISSWQDKVRAANGQTTSWDARPRLGPEKVQPPPSWSHPQPARQPAAPAPAPEPSGGFWNGLFGGKPKEDDFDADLDRRIAEARSQWAAMRDNAHALVQTEEQSLVQTEERAEGRGCGRSRTGGWLSCTGKVLWSPFWLCYKAGVLTFKAFGAD